MSNLQNQQQQNPINKSTQQTKRTQTNLNNRGVLHSKNRMRSLNNFRLARKMKQEIERQERPPSELDEMFMLTNSRQANNNNNNNNKELDFSTPTPANNIKELDFSGTGLPFGEEFSKREAKAAKAAKAAKKAATANNNYIIEEVHF